jgi:hypothetical protein
LSRKTEPRPGPSTADPSKRGRVTVKAVNDALAKRGRTARLFKADGYFYFDSGEAADWIDKTVSQPTLGSLTLEQWLQEFDRLEKVHGDLLKMAGPRASKKKIAAPSRKR